MATIYSLALHEELELDRYNVVKRVPGGWLYKSFTGTQENNFNPIGVEFVPYDAQYFPAIDLTPEPLELGTYNYNTSSPTTTSTGIFNIAYSGEFSEPVTLTMIFINTGTATDWEYRKTGSTTWITATGNPLSFSVAELDAGGGSINVECRRLISNHGANTSIVYTATFRLSAEGGSIIDDAIAQCTVIGQAAVIIAPPVR